MMLMYVYIFTCVSFLYCFDEYHDNNDDHDDEIEVADDAENALMLQKCKVEPHKFVVRSCSEDRRLSAEPSWRQSSTARPRPRRPKLRRLSALPSWRQSRTLRALVERFDIEPFPDFSAK